VVSRIAGTVWSGGASSSAGVATPAAYTTVMSRFDDRSTR
jgi:hypothetical protein